MFKKAKEVEPTRYEIAKNEYEIAENRVKFAEMNEVEEFVLRFKAAELRLERELRLLKGG